MLYRARGLERRIRGGATALAGLLLVAAGVFGTIFGVVGLSNQLVNQAYNTGVAIASTAILLVYALFGFSLASSGLGVMMVAFARAERDRSEELLLDPLRYFPFHRRWLRGVPLAVVVVLILFLFGGLAAPVAHAMSVSLQVVACSGSPPAPGAPGTTVWSIPGGATFTLHWYASNGRPVTEVALLGLPYVGSIGSLSSLTINSSQGWTGGDSNGTAVELWACDNAGLLMGSGPAQVVVSATYYTPLLG